MDPLECPRPSRPRHYTLHYPLRNPRPARPQQDPHHYQHRSPRPARPQQDPHHYQHRSPRPARPAGRHAALLAPLRCLRPPGRIDLLTAPCSSRLPAVAVRGPRRSRWSRLAVAVRIRDGSLRSPSRRSRPSIPPGQHRDRTTALPSRLPHPRVLTARSAHRSHIRRRSRWSRRPARVRSSLARGSRPPLAGAPGGRRAHATPNIQSPGGLKGRGAVAPKGSR